MKKSKTVREVIAPAPLRHSLDEYWLAPSDVDRATSLGCAWRDKPHRVLYDLIAAMIHLENESAALKVRLASQDREPK